MAVGVENRWDRRLSVNVAAELRHPTAGQFGAKLRDMSSGGVFVTTHAPLEPGMVVELSAPMPEGVWVGTVRFQGLIIWTRAGGAGVMFCQDDDVAYPLLRGHIRTARPPLPMESPSPLTSMEL